MKVKLFIISVEFLRLRIKKMSWRTRKGSLHFDMNELFGTKKCSRSCGYSFFLCSWQIEQSFRKRLGEKNEEMKEKKKMKSKKKEIGMKRKSHQIKIKDVNLWYFCNAYDFFHSASWEERNQIILLFKKRKEKKRKEKKRKEKKRKEKKRKEKKRKEKNWKEIENDWKKLKINWWPHVNCEAAQLLNHTEGFVPTVGRKENKNWIKRE